MKEGWEIKKLGEITTKIGSGATPRGGNVSYKTEGISLIRSMNVHDFEFRDKNLAFIDDQQAKELNNVALQENDVLLNITGASVTRCCVVPKEYLPARVNQHVSIIRAKKEVIDPLFLNLLLTSKHYKDQLLFTGEQGATRQAITKAELESFNIAFPKSLPEQQRIVSILDEAFTAIAKAKANAEQNLWNSQELFESLLIKIFTEGISIKKWKLEKLEKYNKVVVGYVGPISKEYTNDENGILLLSTKNIGVNGVSLEKLTRINHQFHNKNRKSQLVPEDILVARHGNSGQSAVIPNNIKTAHALNVIIIKKSESLSSEYICFLLNSGVLDKIASSKAGSVQEIINTSIIKDLIIPVPSVKEQQTIVQKLNALSTQTKKLESIYQQKINDLEEMKKSILQKAFSGELKTEKVMEV
ncbi:MAG: restriction endonuclease subunit S [Leadbetterella sp.]|nr:restriction endonuclease subunit S [Leadbetterella sp.]